MASTSSTYRLGAVASLNFLAIENMPGIILRNWPTAPSFGTLAFQNGLEYWNAVSFDLVTPEFTRLECVYQGADRQCGVDYMQCAAGGSRGNPIGKYCHPSS